MMRLYLGCYVYEYFVTPAWMHWGCCDELALYKLEIQDISACFTGWKRVSKYDRLSTINAKGSLTYASGTNGCTAKMKLNKATQRVPSCFFLAIHPIVHHIKSECDLFVHHWYVDNGLLV